MITGASGASNLEFPTAMNAVLGTRMKLVRGYKGPADILLALERGEVQGMCGMVNTIVGTQRPDWFRDKKVRILAADRARTHRAHGQRAVRAWTTPRARTTGACCG